MDSGRKLTFKLLDDKIQAHGNRVFGMNKDDNNWHPVSWSRLRSDYLKLAMLIKEVQTADSPVVGIFSNTRYEWNVSDFATLALGGIVVGLYSNDRDEVILHILSLTRPDVLIIEDQASLERIRGIDPDWGDKRPVILLKGESKKGPLVYLLADWLPQALDRAAQEELNSRIANLGEEQTASYVFTSGTSGLPKGAILTQKNLFNTAQIYERYYPLDENDRTLLYLPFSHVFARVMFYSSILWGQTHYYMRKLEELVDDFSTVNPTVVLMVPRFLEKIKAKIEMRVSSSSALRKNLFFWATRVGFNYHVKRQQGLLNRIPLGIANILVLNKVRGVFGKNLRFIGSGGGHLPDNVAAFFQQIGIPVYAGYATTESGGMGIFNYPADARNGTVGRAIPNVAVKLNHDGEICLHSDSVFNGYLHDPEATAEVLRDGYYLTGDIGRLDEDGYLSIIDRKKDILVTAYGKNIAPAWVEEKLMQIPLIDDAVVFGDKRPFLVAIIVPNEDALHNYGNDLTSRELLEIIRQQVSTLNDSLARHETIRKFILAQPFDVAKGTITSTFKKRRQAIHEKYRGQIAELYTQDNNSEKTNRISSGAGYAADTDEKESMALT